MRGPRRRNGRSPKEEDVTVKRTMWVGTALGVIVATTGGAFATSRLVDRGPRSGWVLAVDRMKETIRTTRE
ncbi:MAG TPA: hypothetical protein DCQ75_13180, partial [Pseudomonas sp.]|nr:hypothetical protein [Pseudomonas sp.]